MAERFPKDFIERHPDTRETFSPPTQKNETDIKGLVTLNVKYEDKPAPSEE
jgi:hypothetical protein